MDDYPNYIDASTFDDSAWHAASDSPKWWFALWLGSLPPSLLATAILMAFNKVGAEIAATQPDLVVKPADDE